MTGRGSPPTAPGRAVPLPTSAAPWRDGASSAEALVSLTVVGVDHRTTPAEIRDGITVTDGRAASVLRSFGDLGLGEGLVLSTCDRVEFLHFADPDGEAGSGNDGLAAAFAEVICQGTAMPPERLLPCINVWRGAAALDHIFSVAASLASQIVGEPQVLGQVKQAHQTSAALGFAGPRLGRVMDAAYAVAKRVRTETSIGTHAVSMASAAYQIARDIHGNLARSSGALLGLGEMGELLGGHLIGAGLGRLTVWHPSPRRAAELAARIGAHAGALTPEQGAVGRVADTQAASDPDARSLDEVMAESDITIAAFGTGRRRITAEIVNRALKRRRYRPIFLLDTAIPGDIDREVAEQEDAYLYTLDDLENVAEAGLAERRATAGQAQAIVTEAVCAFAQAALERDAVPLIRALRDHFETERRAVLESMGRDAAGDIDRATALLAARLLHGPMQRLRGASATAGPGRRLEFEAVIKWLFALENGGGPRG